MLLKRIASKASVFIKSTPIQSAIWYTVSNFLVKALGFITIPIFTRLLTQDQFGDYHNYLSWLSVMSIIASFNLVGTLISAKRDFPNDLQNYVFSMAILSMLSTAVWLIIVNILREQFEALFLLDISYINSMLVYVALNSLVSLFQTWERFTYRYKVTVAISMILAIGVSACSVALTVALPNKLDGAIIGKVLPAILVGISLFVWFLKKRSKCRIEYWKYALPIAWPFIPHLLAMTLLGVMNKIFITQMCGSEANALYSLALSCCNVISIFISSLNSAFSPWLGDKLTQKDYGRIKHVFKIYVGIFMTIAVGVSLLIPEILWILGGDEYVSAKYAIPPIAIGCIFQFVYTMYVNVEQYEKKTKGMAVASVSAAALNAVLDVLIIPVFGYLGAAYASAIAYGWLMLVHAFLVRRIGLFHVYDNRFNIAVTFITCVLIAATALLYPFALLRWVLFAIYCAVFLICGYHFRHKIKDFLKK